MSKSNSVILLGFLIAILMVLAGVTLSKGALLIAKHEGDTLHLMQIVLRMAQGEVPHLDFMTPIGALSFAPIVFFIDLGYGIGQAILQAQVLIAAAILPAVWWVGASRLNTPLALFFGAAVMVLTLALVHGEAQSSVSISMHYNRWAWAFAFVAIALAALPPLHRSSSVADGVFVGLALSALAMIKVTYFAAFVVPIFLGFALRKQYPVLLYAVLTGFFMIGVITFMVGPDYWFAYFNDLLTVARSDVRSFPGRALGEVVGAPAYLGASLIAILSIIFLRQARQEVGGLLMLLLVPGFFYVTFQNFGNDPQWLLLLAVLVFALRPEAAGLSNGFGWDLRAALGVIGVAAMAMSAPSFINLTYSPFRHYATNIDNYSPILPRSTQHTDLLTPAVRANRVDGAIALDEPGSGLEAYATLAEREEVGTLFGAPLPRCELTMGLSAWFDAIVTDLDQAGFAEGRRVFAADLFSSHWMYGPFLPLKQGAPWFYGGLPGYDSADYVLVPQCAVSVKVRKQIIDLIEEEGTRLEEIRRTPLYILLEKV